MGGEGGGRRFTKNNIEGGDCLKGGGGAWTVLRGRLGKKVLGGVF